MTTTTLPGTEVRAFAAAVRAALSDLPPDELDELADGLEADLSERAAESGVDLGDPATYAEELRAAAGYPPRSATSHVGGVLPDLRSLPRELLHRWRAFVADSAPAASVLAFLLSLRPVWWVLRAFVIWVIVVTLLGAGTNFWPLAVVLVVLSVQLGRGRMLGRPGMRWALRVVSAVAVIATPFVGGWLVNTWNTATWQAAYYDESQGYGPGPGLSRNGTTITNIYAYDAAGNPIDQVQLFDQDGTPLNLTDDTAAPWYDAPDGSMLVPSGDVPGRAGWNVFPLEHVNDWSDVEDDGRIDDSEVSPATFPEASVKPLAGYQAPVDDGTDAGAGE